MRYQELRAARETLINAVSYLINNPQQITIFTKKVDIAALFVLRTALQEVREELKHPERFNLDGSRRTVRVWPSKLLGQKVNTIRMRRIHAESAIA